jgi:glycosyltransferase involved in cell wall biosynthesis
VHDGASVPSKLSTNKNRNTICYSGQFYWWKGMSTLIESLRWVNGASLRLYGGEYSTVQDDIALMNKVIQEHSLQDKIEFRGFIPPSKIGHEIQECEIGVLPLPNNIIANRCNSPLKLFDYMANGLAVVSSDLLTVKEIITHGETGHLVQPDNPRALADGINQILSNDVYRQQLVTNAFKAAKKYSWQQRGTKLSEFLLTLKAEKKTSQ